MNPLKKTPWSPDLFAKPEVRPKVFGFRALIICSLISRNAVSRYRGDPIIGFITRGRGVVIHRRDCKNILKLLDDPDRAIDVEWDVERDKEFMVHLKLLGEDRKDFLKEITERISEADTNIVSAEMHSENGVVHGTFIIEVKNLNQLNRVMRKIKTIPGIIDLQRLNGG